MSHYLVAAAACEEVDSQVNSEEPRVPSLRARLEESVQHSIQSLEHRARQDVRIVSKERARAEREAVRAAEQQERNDRLLREILTQRAAPKLPPVSLVEVETLSSIDTFQRLKIEDDRRKRMAHPSSGIAGMYNTLDRPLSSTQSITDVDCVPTVYTLLSAEGKGIEATRKREAAHEDRRRNLASEVSLVRQLETMEVGGEARQRLRRDLDRYDEIRTAPTHVLSQHPLPTAETHFAGKNPFNQKPSNHPIDAYHTAIRAELLSDVSQM